MLQRARNTVFWDMTPLNVIEIYISFGGTSSYILQDRGLVRIHRVWRKNLPSFPE